MNATWAHRNAGVGARLCQALVLHVLHQQSRLGAQHSTTLTTQQRPAQHTPQCHTHDTAEPAWRTAQRHTHNSRARLHTHRSATLTTAQPAPHAAAPHSQQQSLARHTTRRCTHDAAEAAILRPCLVKRCGSLSRVQCLLGIKGCYTAWHPQWAEYRVPGISRGRAGPAYHHPRLSAWRISLPLLPCLGSVGLMALIPSGPSTRGHS